MVKEKESSRYVIGIDLGGTKIELGIVDEDGQIHEHQRLQTLNKEGAKAVEDQILSAIHLLKQSNYPISGIGIGAAGQIDTSTSKIIFSPNLRWHQVPLKSNIEKASSLPVKVMNDVRAITWGEWKYGAGKNEQDLLCIFIGTGIGGGIVSHGQMLMGASNTFGEIGHVTMDFKGPVCTCGKKGCLEAFSGGWGIAARAQELIQKDPQSASSQFLLNLAQQQIVKINAKIVMEGYGKGNEIARFVFDQAKTALIAGIASFVNAFNPSCLVIGGGVIDGIPELFQVIQAEVPNQALKAATQNLKIVKAQLGKEVGVIGAAAAMFDFLNDKSKK